jgi:hypothetical protein
MIRYLNRPDKSDPNNLFRTLVVGPGKFTWKAWRDNGWRCRYRVGIGWVVYKT